MLFIVLERRPHFIGYMREEAPILLGNFWRTFEEFIYLCPKLCWRLAGVLWSTLDLEGWSSRSSYFICVA